ncbi:hypothetical protein [Xanthobacter flavus]|uniref:hypothetical protein n=1 Tax=Xanthobacter flavus TaxID=281 RepID=UPI003729BFA2
MFHDDLKRLLEPLLLAALLMAAIASESRPPAPVSLPDFSVSAERWKEAYKTAEPMIGLGN